MAFSAFKHQTDVVEKLGLSVNWQNFVPEELPALTPSVWLKNYLSLSRPYDTASEKSRSEYIIAPVLLEMIDRNRETFSVVSGPQLDLGEKGLSGEIDFAICVGKEIYELEAPAVVIVEAKKGELELGYWQCAAEMLAAAKYNQQKDKAVETVYGCVSSGVSWQFLKLTALNLSIEKNIYSVSYLAQLLAVWNWILNSSDPRNRRQ